jgi:methyl-accepting chemotaxis protein
VIELDESHRKISGHRKDSDAAQSAHLDAWNQAMDHLQPTVQQLDRAVKGLQGGIHDIGQFTESLAIAAAPTALAAESFRKVSEVMESAIPAFQSNMVSQEAMRKAIDEAARRIQHGTTGYLQAAELVRQVVSEIDQSQEDLSRARSLDRNAQNEQLAAWETALDRLLPALEALKRTTTDLDGLSSSFANAAHPAIEAGAAFHNAALEAGRILPQLEAARDGYEAINTSLSSTAQELARSSQSYTSAGAQVGELLGQLETSMSLQNAGNEQLEKTLDRASRFTEQLPEASKMVVDAAQGLQGASLRTAEVVSSITDAVKVQDDTVGQMKDTAKVLVSVLQRQSGQWEQFHSEMDRLQQVLDTSVDTFTKQMPEAIDHTLVHFDAALAEGVERLGSAVERLREAMDDLQERLEQVLEKD